jgi:hypothetical protein
LVQVLVAESEAAKDASAFTQSVLDLRDKYVALIADAFANDRTFLQALNSSFEVRTRPLLAGPIMPFALKQELSSGMVRASPLRVVALRSRPRLSD